ncbi:hypothetical protein B0T20DRAFT_351120 [Sordaria brevicollis]|uniref:Copper acquisition factor BIM1-like domain-containing protein n=1 Tax=Sordaria brevicollis TaxID=83679 RepID=A0AAE0UD82_SORBR|nr:hypothetical protein B0T20DRAFT_351120 [Sordaria brevicollis]
MRASLLLSLGLSTLTSAHFALNHPTSLEGSSIDESKEDTAPCGALVPSLASTDPKITISDFHVDGDYIALHSGHPQYNWLFRGSVQELSEGNWTQLYPIFQQSGLGDLCQQKVTVPKGWVGKKGVVGVVGSSGDGTLFQCAVVNFVEGSNSNVPNTCTNSTGVTADYTSDATLSALVGEDVQTGNQDNKTDESAGVVVRAGGVAAMAAAVVAGVMML